MVEDKPLPAHTFETAVVVAGHVQTVLAPAAVQPHVAVGLQDAPVDEIPVRVLAGGVAEHVAVFLRVDEIVGIPDLADGAGLVKAVALKAGAKGQELAGQDAGRLAGHG